MMQPIIIPNRRHRTTRQKAAWSLGSAAWIFAMFALAMLLKDGAQ